MRELTKLN